MFKFEEETDFEQSFVQACLRIEFCSIQNFFFELNCRALSLPSSIDNPNMAINFSSMCNFRSTMECSVSHLPNILLFRYYKIYMNLVGVLFVRYTYTYTYIRIKMMLICGWIDVGNGST